MRRTLLARRLDVRDARLCSGLVLGLFLLVHLANLGLGLVSVETMEGAAPAPKRPESNVDLGA